MGKRVDNRRSRRRRRRLAPWGAIGVAAAVVFLAVGLYITSRRSSVPRAAGSVAKSKSVADIVQNLKKYTFLIVGVESEGDAGKATGLLVFGIDNYKKAVGGLIIPPNTFVEVNGRGSEPIAESYGGDMSVMMKTVGAFIGVRPRRYFIVPGELFVAAARRGDIKKLLRQASRTDAGPEELRAVMDDLAVIPREKITITDLPVRPIAIGEATYFDVKNKQLAKLVKLFWGIKPVRREAGNRVIILNGNGRPGVARQAADKLLGREFKIIDIKNAGNFNYRTSQIIIYNEHMRQKAKKIKKLLGVGGIILKNTPQDVVDIVVIIGSDYS